MKRQIATHWIKNTPDPEVAKRFESLLRGNVIVNERLVQILKEKLETNKPKTSDYDIPAWPFFRAHKDGYDQAIREVLELFNFLDQRNSND